MNDNERKSLNAQRVQKMHPWMRDNILAIIADLEAAGWQPIIDSGVYRTPAEQAQKVAQGYSKIYYSYHNVTGANGTPESLAADIVDERYQWESPMKYWLQLAGAAENQGLETGIYWYLSQSARNNIHNAIKEQKWDAKVQLGGDVAHVQPPQADFTTGEAKKGYRFNPGHVRPLILTSSQTTYRLLGSLGNLMDTLPVFDGTAYVSARKWAYWFGVVVQWDASLSKVIMAKSELSTKIIDGLGYVPVREAAKVTGLQVGVDSDKRTITLSRQVTK